MEIRGPLLFLCRIAGRKNRNILRKQAETRYCMPIPRSKSMLQMDTN